MRSRRCSSLYSTISYFKEKNRLVNQFYDNYFDKFDIINSLAVVAEGYVTDQFKLCKNKS